MIDDKPEHKKIDARKIPNPKHYPKALLEYNKMNPTVSFKLNADQKLRLMNKAVEKNTTMANYCRNIVIRYGLGDMSFKDVPEIREEKNESYNVGYKDGYYSGSTSHLLLSVFIVVFLMLYTGFLQMRTAPYHDIDLNALYTTYIVIECALLGLAIYYLVKR